VHTTQEIGDTVRKFILNSSIISAAIGGFSAVQATRKGPRDWRLILMWVSWGITVALAIGSVLQDDEEARQLGES
jgi:hypothetical protein